MPPSVSPSVMSEKSRQAVLLLLLLYIHMETKFLQYLIIQNGLKSTPCSPNGLLPQIARLWVELREHVADVICACATFHYILLTWKQKVDKEKPLVTSMAKYYWNEVDMPLTPLYLKELITGTIHGSWMGATPCWDLFQ